MLGVPGQFLVSGVVRFRLSRAWRAIRRRPRSGGVRRERANLIRITERAYRDGDRRRAWAISWRLQDGLPPGASPDAIRVAINSGYWDLRPTKGSDRSTDTRYCVLTDPAGSLPKWIVGMANTEGVPQIFAAVASAAASPRYATLPPPAEDGDLAERPPLGDCGDSGGPAR